MDVFLNSYGKAMNNSFMGHLARVVVIIVILYFCFKHWQL